MNEDYENEEQNEEEDSSSYYDIPPSSNNVFYTVKNKIRGKTSQLKKRAASTFFNALKNIAVTIITNPILFGVILFFVFVAIIWLVLSEETSKKVVQNVDSYIAKSETIDETAKDLYLTRHSLLLLKIKEINEIYDEFIKDKSISGDIRRAMKTKVGKNDVEKQKATAANNNSGSSSSGDIQVSTNGEGVATLGGPYDPKDNQVLTKQAGRVNFEGHTETYYSQRVLPGGGLNIPGRHVAEDGTIRDKDNYVCVASDDLPKGTLINTSLGMGKVYDCGSTHNNIDIYVDW